VLLPTREGHGLSVKTVEAMSSGLPLVATSLAFRGMGIDPAGLRNVFVADDPAAFAAAMLGPLREQVDPRTSDTGKLYAERFSDSVYENRLGDIACKLIAGS